MSGEMPGRQTRRPYEVGTPVEIRNRFDRSWSTGFRVHAVTDEGRYRVARSSDDTVLPTEFDPAEVRRHRRDNLWWVP